MGDRVPLRHIGSFTYAASLIFRTDFSVQHVTSNGGDIVRELNAEKKMAEAMLCHFREDAAQRASDNAYLEALISNDGQAAYWRRVTALIVDSGQRMPALVARAA